MYNSLLYVADKHNNITKLLIITKNSLYQN